VPTPRQFRVPSLRRHGPSRQAVVTLSGRDHYLGPWPDGLPDPPAEAQAAYDRLIARWLAGQRRPLPASRECRRRSLAGADLDGPDADLTVSELILRFLEHAEGYYCTAAGQQTAEVDNYRYSLRPLNHAFGAGAARKFRPRRLKAVRQLMVEGYVHPEFGPQPGLARKLINARVARIVRVFRWAGEEELVPAAVYVRLSTVRPLQRGRTKARETARVRPVPPEHVQAVLPHVRPNVAAMVRLQALTGLRPGEVCRLRLAELDRAGDVWTYRPPQHKTAHRERERVVAVGPRAQAVILEFVRVRCPSCGACGRPPRIGCRDGALCGPCADRMDEAGICGPWKRCEAQDPDACLFSPARDREERFLDMRKGRKSKVQPSQEDRKKAKPARVPGESYTPTNYNNAIKRACEKAGVPPWHANRLRHAHGTAVRKLYGLEGSQAALGHARAETSEIYAEKNLDLAARIARDIG
jgi:integrase